jgi:hypothetical protein
MSAPIVSAPLPSSVCSAPPPSPHMPTKWRSRGCNFASMELRRRRMASSRSLVVLPETIPDRGLMNAEVEPEPRDTKLSPTPLARVDWNDELLN